MYKKQRELMKRISNYCGDRVDYVQGGGGNTSVKLNEQLMAIKASGYTLKVTTAQKGFVTVDYRKISEYYNDVDPGADTDFDKESHELNMSSIVLLPGMEKRRPSVEVGMHSFLKKYVIHTHSVYANILCCSLEGRELAHEIFCDDVLNYIFIPYIDPGFRLALAIKEKVEEFKDQNGCMPDVIFMENHGVISTNDDAEKAIALHELVNESVIKRFNLEEYPIPMVKKTKAGFESSTQYLLDFSQTHGLQEYFEALRLYPDQLVYVSKALGQTIMFEDARIIYASAEKEAKVIEETLLGVAYVVGEIEKASLTLRQMDEKSAGFINNWESEKYRSQMVKQKGES